MTIEELNQEEFFAFFAPDGSWQCATTAPDFETCMATATVLSSLGVWQHPSELFEKGFEIRPIKITLVANGTQEEGFNKSKEKYSN